MARLKIRQRNTRGSGCITRDKNSGTYYYLLNNPASGKRERHRLTTIDQATGQLRNCTTEAEAESAAAAILARTMELDGIQTKERAQAEIARTRKLILAMEKTPEDIWPAFVESQTRRQDTSEARMQELKRVAGLFAAHCAREGIRDLSSIDGNTIPGFVNAVSKGKTARTYNAYLSCIQILFKHTWKPLGFDNNPAEGMARKTAKTTEQGHKELTEAQVRALFDGFSGDVFKYTSGDGGTGTYKPKDLDQIRIALLFCTYTGARAIDACCMKWSNVNLGAARITYKPTKTSKTSGKVVAIPMDATLLSALKSDEVQAWKGTNQPGEDYITPSLARRYLANPSTIGKVVSRLIELATGLKATGENDGTRARGAALYGFHSLRHSFVSFAINAGISPTIIADLVGHGSPAMTRAYSHIEESAKRKAIATLPKLSVAGQDDAQERRRRLHDYIEKATPDELEALEQFWGRRLN